MPHERIPHQPRYRSEVRDRDDAFGYSERQSEGPRIETNHAPLFGPSRLPPGRPFCFRGGHCERRRVSTATNVLHTIAIKLKIPDNTAFSALTALRRLGVDVDRVERADIWQFAGPGSSDDVATSVKRNESLFNPNKHVLEVLESPSPRAGETWISNIPIPGDVPPGSSKGAAKHYVAWRLFADHDRPADKATVASAIEKLLCNPAIERAIM